ncbi:hypothetical protein PybrP1_002036 [[Pythium] brassicae (nom. inval.)]|nr:hypothetical protein PybrP1_002036 [[Pythium] brassicae (nom. inval.)]
MADTNAPTKVIASYISNEISTRASTMRDCVVREREQIRSLATQVGTLQASTSGICYADSPLSENPRSGYVVCSTHSSKRQAAMSCSSRIKERAVAKHHECRHRQRLHGVESPRIPLPSGESSVCQYHAVTYWKKLAQRPQYNMTVSTREELVGIFGEMVFAYVQPRCLHSTRCESEANGHDPTVPTARVRGGERLRTGEAALDISTSRPKNATLRQPDAVERCHCEVLALGQRHVCNDLEWDCTCAFFTSVGFPCQHLMCVARGRAAVVS